MLNPPEKTIGTQETASVDTEAGTPNEASADKITLDSTKDIAKTIVIDGTEYLLSDLKNELGRAQMASRFKSDADKAQAQIEQHQSVIDERDQLQQKIAQIEQTQSMEALLKDRISALGTKEEENSWSTDDGLPVDTESIVNQILEISQQTANKAVNELDATDRTAIRDIIAEEMQKAKEQQAREARMQYSFDTVRLERAKRYTELGFSNAEADELCKILDSARHSESQGDSAAADGDDTTAVEKWNESLALNDAVSKRVAEQMVVHKAEADKQTLLTQLDNGTFTIPEGEETEEKEMYTDANGKKQKWKSRAEARAEREKAIKESFRQHQAMKAAKGM
jgi:hypothetical protein